MLLGTNAAVSIVTRDGFSDDANGANVEANELWLRMARQGDTFILHYALPTAPDVQRFSPCTIFSLSSEFMSFCSGGSR